MLSFNEKLTTFNLPMKKRYHQLHIALPVLDESTNLPAFLAMLGKQSFRDFTLHVCVNQPEEWWDDERQHYKCLDNGESLRILATWDAFPVKVVDRSSRGKGWAGKRHGVGWARKTVMDSINDAAGADDLIVSMDADTLAGEQYLDSVLENFNRHQDAVALAVPYYHPLTGDPEADRAILRYELYMRNYNINLFRISSPYSYTALGSALAFPVWAYRKIGGMTPMMSGEDFYFLQKMVKTGKVLFWNREKVYPAARFSDRVYFGTGPAMEKGRRGDWDSYPIYHHSLFRKIEETYQLFSQLYCEDKDTPMDDFFVEIFKDKDIWDSLRKNVNSEGKFIKACHARVDGLRLLQFLKQEQKKVPFSDEECLKAILMELYPDFTLNNSEEWGMLDFARSPIGFLDGIRNEMVEIEESEQKAFMRKLT